jgi:dephospho-CoA kinase
MSRRLIVGLTGNIATGKSVVMRLAAERGALTVDADRVVHELLDGDTEIQEAVAEEFGPEVSRSDGRIDRAALGQIVFGDEEKLRRLEALLHPAVRLEIARRIASAGAPVVMVEAIKLLEGPLADVCDQVWVTACARAVQLERLRVCRGLEEAAAVARVDAQPPQDEKVSRADVVIDTNGSMPETVAQFEAAWAMLLHESAA